MQSQLDNGIFPIYKARGETLAVLLDRFRSEHNVASDTKLTYAGRLDPMAEGLVLVLAGEARFDKDVLLGLPKTYIVDILLGVSTDTLDPLGVIEKVDIYAVENSAIEDAVSDMRNITSLPYPIYSSVPVDGKPLFVHARAGTPVSAPLKNVTIHSAIVTGIQQQPLSMLAARSIEDVGIVVGDFRQDAIIKGWKALLKDKRNVTIVTIEIAASSGTYMRSLAEWVGHRLHLPALAYGINRVKLGEYEIGNK